MLPRPLSPKWSAAWASDGHLRFLTVKSRENETEPSAQMRKQDREERGERGDRVTVATAARVAAAASVAAIAKAARPSVRALPREGGGFRDGDAPRGPRGPRLPATTTPARRANPWLKSSSWPLAGRSIAAARPAPSRASMREDRLQGCAPPRPLHLRARQDRAEPHHAVSAKKQRELARAIKRARFLGLLPYVLK